MTIVCYKTLQTCKCFNKLQTSLKSTAKIQDVVNDLKRKTETMSGLWPGVKIKTSHMALSSNSKPRLYQACQAKTNMETESANLCTCVNVSKSEYTVHTPICISKTPVQLTDLILKMQKRCKSHVGRKLSPFTV